MDKKNEIKQEQGGSGGVRLSDLVQMECLARNSSVIELYREQSLGRIYIEDGQITHAVCNDIAGEGAFYRLLAMSGCAFELHEYTMPPERTVNRTWEFLLAGAKRRRELLDFCAKTDEASSTSSPTFSSEPTGQASEMLICSGAGEVLYSWQCPAAGGRIALMQNIARLAEGLVPELKLGKLDRLEIQSAGTRDILQTRADRLIFTRLAVNHAGT